MQRGAAPQLLQSWKRPGKGTVTAGSKAGQVVYVDPAYTSQACKCGHTAKSNRPSQAVFACGAYGFRANADHNAALNILVRAGLPSAPVPARGTGAAARRGALPPWSVARSTKGTRATREPDMRGGNHRIYAPFG